jgi:serralysin
MSRRLILLMGAVISLSACLAGYDADPPTGDRWEEFKRSAVLLTEDPVPRYVFGGDMVATGEDGLRREYERYFGKRPGSSDGYGEAVSYLTVDNVNGADVLLEPRYSDSSGGRYDLTYCIERNTFSAAELTALITALAQATDSWSGLVNVAFRYEPSQDANCGSENTSVFFNVRGVAGSEYNAFAFFPEDARAARELLVYDVAFTTTSGGRDLQGILRHETGHILGFRHEHIWLGDDCTGEEIADGRHVTPYDEDSVMHYPQCRTSGTSGYRQTSLDYQGAIGLYGLAASQITLL